MCNRFKLRPKKSENTNHSPRSQKLGLEEVIEQESPEEKSRSSPGEYSGENSSVEDYFFS
jgi:hypothetical protein